MNRFWMFKGFTLLLVVFFTLSACDKDEDPVPEEFAELSFNGETVLEQVPDGLKNSTDEYAQQCYELIQDAVDMTGFLDNMDVPDDAQRSSSKGTDETWQWTWSYGGESFTFYWSYHESGGKRYWDMDISYNNGPRLSYIDAWETLDGTEGEVIYNFEWAYAQYGEEIQDEDLVHWRYSWKLDSSGKYTLGFIWEDATDEAFYLEYNITINADGSGYLDYFLAGELFYHMEWDVLGNGSWAWYSEGQVWMEGSWTV